MSTEIIKYNKVDKKNETKSKIKHIRYSTIFEWDGEAQCVYLTGSFCNWEQFFEMKKSSSKNNKFFLTLFLPKGIYQYKFKIDNIWKYNSNFPIYHDNSGNTNNILDLTKENKEEMAKTDISSIFTSKENEANNNETKFISNLKLFDSNENNEEIQKPPLIYSQNFDINFLSNQNDLGLNNTFLQSKEENILCDNYSCKKILPLKHELLEHFFVNINSLKHSENIKKCENKNNVLIEGKTFKYRYKLATFIYYKPFRFSNNQI